MPRANVLARDAGRLAGTGTAPRRLVDLIDAEFLAGIGYDARTRRITFPDDHPLLGRLRCPVTGCSGPARIGLGAMCAGCYGRWTREPAGMVLEEFLATSKPREHRDRAGPVATVDLARFGPVLRDQVLALISLQRDSGRAGLGVSILRMFTWIEDHHIKDLNDPAFLARGNSSGLRGFRRTAYEDLQLALTRPEEEKLKDVWNLRVFGYPKRMLSFRGGGEQPGPAARRSPLLSQQWLRSTTKEFVYRTLLPRQMSASTMTTYVRAVGELSVTLALRPDGGENPTVLGHRDIEQHLIRMNQLERSGRMSNEEHHRMFVFGRRFLAEVTALGLNDPGESAAGLPPGFAFRQSDTVKKDRRSIEEEVAGSALPDVVMDQLFSAEALDVLVRARGGGHQSKRLVQLLADVGRRPGEVVTLPFQCLEFDDAVDELGGTHRSPVLIYNMPKTSWVGKRLPIHASTAAIIQEQQADLRTRFPGTPPAELALWPSPIRNPTGTKAMNTDYLGQVLRGWMLALPRLDGPDVDELGHRVPFDRSRVFAYAFRHTFAQRHADAGVGVDVLKELMGHEQFNTTQVYYQVTAKRKRAAVQLVAPLQVNRDGTRTRPALHQVLDSESLREDVGSLSIPYGLCVEPSNVRSHGRSCSFRYQCFGCSHFRTDPSYLPELRAYLTRRLADLEVLRAGSSDITPWAAESAMPRDEEIEAIRNLIRTCERELEEMTAKERAAVEQAINQMRRARRDLDQALPVSAGGAVRQSTPVLFPTITFRRERGQS